MNTDTSQKQGKVKFYTHERGFGVITDDDGIDYFVHVNNLQIKEHLLGPGIHVIFQSRARPRKSGLEAYAVELPPKGDLKMGIDFENIHLQANEYQANRKRWNLWDDPQIRDLYPELEAYFEKIKNDLNLEFYSLELDQVKRVYPDNIPSGAWPQDYQFILDPENRRGAYVGYKKPGVILIVHAFYKSRKENADYICWRAKAVPYIGGKVTRLPRKEQYIYGSKPHYWCENFESHFLLIDLPIMLANVGQENSETMRGNQGSKP